MLGINEVAAVGPGWMGDGIAMVCSLSPRWIEKGCSTVTPSASFL